MSRLAGSLFDNRFTRDMVADHRKDIREYQQEARRDDAAGQYAKDSLPTLEKHLQTATSLEHVTGRRPVVYSDKTQASC
jgi:putative membrane protein